MFDAMRPQYINEEYTISRRQALVAIAALPTALLAVIQQGQRQAVVIGEFLSRCAASIAACRHLLDGNGLAMVESMLPHYLPALEGLAQEPSAYQQAAAGLAAQAYQMKGILALHRNNQKAREAFVQEAVKYGRISENYNQYVAALEQLVGVFRASERSTEALQTYQEILPSLNKVAPLLRSAVYVTQAWAYAHSGQEQEALRSLALSYETFPDHPENDPSFCHVN